MYATLDLIENSKHSGKIIGVHQKLDKAARQLLAKNLGREIGYFPTIDEILYFEGQANYLAIHTTGNEYRMRSTMTAVEKELENSGFLRIHKGFLVNLEHIKILKLYI